MLNEIFTGGHFSSGTRVVQFILEQSHNIHSEDITKDYERGFSEKFHTYSEKYLRGERIKLEGKNDLVRPFALKNPDFMLSVKNLKKEFPNSKFILLVRNGLDQILCDNRAMFHRHARYFGLPPIKGGWSHLRFLESEMHFWNTIYKYAVTEGGVDYIFRLEDIVRCPRRFATFLQRELGIPKPKIDMIKRPKSMGRYKHKWVVPDTHGYRPKALKEIIYRPSMIPRLYEVGKEMMDYFDYDKDISRYL